MKKKFVTRRWKNDRHYEEAQLPVDTYARELESAPRAPVSRRLRAAIFRPSASFVPAVSSRIPDRTCIRDRHPNRRQRRPGVQRSLRNRPRYKNEEVEKRTVGSGSRGGGESVGELSANTSPAFSA